MGDVSSGLKDKIIHKAKATSIHLILSILVFIIILYFILFEWYPEPFFTAQGGWQGIRLMAFVDLILGPALTLIVYNHLKPRKLIIFDISVIVVIQIAALILGGYTVYSQRPIALVYWGTAFYTVTNDDYDKQGIDAPDFSQYSPYIPPLIYSRPVATEAELELSNSLTNKMIPAYAHTEFYAGIEENMEAILSNEVDMNEIILTNPTMLKRIEELTKGDLDAYRYMALKAKFHHMILIMTEDGILIGSVKAPARG